MPMSSRASSATSGGGAAGAGACATGFAFMAIGFGGGGGGSCGGVGGGGGGGGLLNCTSTREARGTGGSGPWRASAKVRAKTRCAATDNTKAVSTSCRLASDTASTGTELTQGVPLLDSSESRSGACATSFSSWSIGSDMLRMRLLGQLGAASPVGDAALLSGEGAGADLGHEVLAVPTSRPSKLGAARSLVKTKLFQSEVAQRAE
jgi:hypothetical protein